MAGEKELTTENIIKEKERMSQEAAEAADLPPAPDPDEGTVEEDVEEDDDDTSDDDDEEDDDDEDASDGP